MVHLNSDVEGVVNGLVKLHDSCIGIVEFCVLMFMLAILVGAASILIILPTISKYTCTISSTVPRNRH